MGPRKRAPRAPQAGPSRFRIGLLPTLLALAWPGAVLSADGGYRLEASPKVCVRLGTEEPCDMTLELHWSGPRSELPVCLRLRGAEEDLRCWQEGNEGRLRLEHSADSDLVLQLVQAPDTVLEEVEVKVLSRTLKDSRRRRRHVWSIL